MWRIWWKLWGCISVKIIFKLSDNKIGVEEMCDFILIGIIKYLEFKINFILYCYM